MAQLTAVDFARQQRTIERRTALRRMRLVATGLLVVMLVAFVVCWHFEGEIPWLAYPRAFAEAGMVGACADWFAVVALFRHPLGLPIPHTAILPNNKQRIGDTLGVFFVGNFLSSAEIANRLEKIDLASWLSAWLHDPDNVRLIAEWSRGVLPPAIELLGASQLRSASREFIKTGIDGIAAAPLAGRVLAVLVAQGRHVPAFDLGLETVIDFLGKNRQTLRQKASEKASGWLPGWVDAKLADVFLDALLDTLAAGRAADHPWRDEFRTYLDGLVARLAEDPEFYETGERIKTGVLDTKLLDDYLAWLTSETETKLKLDLKVGDGMLASALEHGFAAVADWIDKSESIRDTINRSARQLVMNTVGPHRDDIGSYVSDVVARWDSETLVNRLELTVGKDLQFIRINGTVVGGIVGLILFTITRLLG
jgi:uncharacterized membrane-anchored protein YjiN (DUF445 family)